MSFLNISDSIKETANRIIDLLNAHLDYYKIVAFDKIVMLLTKSVSSAILGLTGFMMLFFGSFAFASFLGEILLHPYLGYLIISVLYGLFGFIVYKNRVNWIVNPMISALSELVEDTSNDLGLEEDIDENDIDLAEEL